jgi:PAS domain S-box-containing protein
MQAVREVVAMVRKALVVDSDFFFVEFVAGLLEQRGYRVCKAYDGKQGITRLEDGPYDLLFADLVMPKVGGRQFFQVVRRKFNGKRFPLVALSGTLVEQMDELDQIGADYFIAKGPIAQLSIQLNEFIDRLEQRSDPPPTPKKIMQTGGVFPRRDAVELLEFLRFYQAAVECLGVGVIIIDKDTRIINANAAALSLVDQALVDLLNRPIWEVFPPNRSGELISALKATAHDGPSPHSAFFARLKGRMVRAVVSSLRVGKVCAGWVVALEGASG